MTTSDFVKKFLGHNTRNRRKNTNHERDSQFVTSFTKTRFKHKNNYTCPACNLPLETVRYVYQAKNRKSYLFECHGCSLIVARPIPITELDFRKMDSIADAELYAQTFKRLHEKLLINKEIREIEKYSKRKNMKLLDVGCGTGWITNVYHKNGFNVTGLEPSEARAEHARINYNIEIISDYIENIEVEKQFDLVIMRHVIEHFSDPFHIILKARELLAMNGLMLVVVPNINCLGRYLFDTNWTWVLPWHCTFFTPKACKYILERSGVTVLKLYQTPSPLYYPDSFARRFPYKLVVRIVSKYRVLLILASSPLAIIGSTIGLGDNITILAKK